MHNLLEIRDVVKKFHIGTPDETTLFSGFGFEVQEGDFIAVVGSNGSGKTTLLNLISGSLQPESGSVLFRDQNITRMPEYRRAGFIGRVFQDPQKGSCPELTILENMALADNKKGRYGLTTAVNRKRMEYYASQLRGCDMGLEDRLNVTVGSLSGGQRQALALVIANMTDIDLLLLDEHTAALDPRSSQTVMRLTDRLIREKGRTTLMVTHNLRFALEYGNRLVMMHAGQVVLDVRGEEKAQTDINDLLKLFNEISIECGN